MSRAQRIWKRWALIVLVLMAPIGAHALGLGEARVESFLNQTLDVRMRLLDATEDNLDSLTVAPADPEDYERLGLMAESLALRLEVTVDRSVSPPVVRVTSDREVTDPVVQLLIDARWANGRVLREYTLFLDPATVAVEAPAPAAPSPSAEPEATTRPAPAPEPGPSGAAASAPPAQPQPQPQPQAVTRSSDGRYGPVESGETLWSIAQSNLPAGDVTMDQMMVAIVELNPRAFRDGNINRLLRGAELRLPDAEQARALDAAAAAAEVAAQNRAFRQRTSADTPVVSDAGRAGTGSEQGSAAADAPRREAGQTEDGGDAADGAAVESRLSLVPPGDEESGAGLSDGEVSEVADLRQRLARAEEELYAARQEAEEFQSRVEELESLVRDNPGGIGIRDAELAGLQRTLRAAREATREGADPAMRSRVSRRLDDYLDQFAAAAEGDAAAPDEGIAAVPDADAPIDDAAPAGAADQAAEPQEAQADAGDAPAGDRTPEESSTGLFGNPMLLLLVGVIVLMLLLAAVRLTLRRRTTAETPGPAVQEGGSPGPAAGDFETPLEKARARVASRPADLSAHLALLQTLATEGSESRFGEALDEMFDHVESGHEPEWREALDLAGHVVPDHSLVKGSSDWISDAGGAEAPQAESQLEEDAEVDDLMSRLDADMEETDDRDWLDEPDSDKAAPDSPLLREVEEPSDTDEGRFRFTGTEVLDSVDTDEDAPIDFDEWSDERPDEAGEGALPGREPPSGDDDDVDDLILDWDADDDRAAAADAPATGADQTQTQGGDADEDDIFAQGDDDIDVKLDLARAYLSWNSTDSARTLLEEVEREGNEAQQQEARKLLDEAAGDSED